MESMALTGENSRQVTCISCPVGCLVTVEKDGDGFCVSGNECVRGEKYCIQEVTRPVRVVTSLVEVSGAALPLCSVKTAAPVPRDKVDEVLGLIRAARASAPIRIGDVLIADAAGTGINVVATANR